MSSHEQNEDRQVVALIEKGVQKRQIYLDKQSGRDFGRPPVPLPDNSYEIHRLWREKKLTLRQAAQACRLPESTFYDKARKFEDSRFSG